MGKVGGKGQVARNFDALRIAWGGTKPGIDRLQPVPIGVYEPGPDNVAVQAILLGIGLDVVQDLDLQDGFSQISIRQPPRAGQGRCIHRILGSAALGVGISHVYYQGHQGQEYDDGNGDHNDRLAILFVPWHFQSPSVLITPVASVCQQTGL